MPIVICYYHTIKHKKEKKMEDKKEGLESTPKTETLLEAVQRQHREYLKQHERINPELREVILTAVENGQAPAKLLEKFSTEELIKVFDDSIDKMNLPGEAAWDDDLRISSDNIAAMDYITEHYLPKKEPSKVPATIDTELEAYYRDEGFYTLD